MFNLQLKILTVIVLITIFTLKPSEATFFDVNALKNPRIITSNHIESPIMKIDSAIQSIPTFEVKNKLKKKILDLPELKNINEIFPKIPPSKTPNGLLSKLAKKQPSAKKFDIFAKNKNIIDLSETINPNYNDQRGIGADETCNCGTDSPMCTNEINVNTNNIPELHEFESKFMNHNDDTDRSSGNSDEDNFILVDDQNFSKDDSNSNLHKLNQFLNDIAKFSINKSGTTKRAINTNTMLNLPRATEKRENETSAEKSKRINDSLQKLMQFVTIMGHVDTFVTKKARDTIRKLSVMIDDDDYDYRRSRRNF